MALRLEIPKSVAARLRLLPSEMGLRLRTELAIALYAQGILSLGKASELGGASRFAFADLIGHRGIPRHYADSAFAEDLAYSDGQ